MADPKLMESKEVYLSDGRLVVLSVAEFADGLVRVEAFAAQEDGEDLTLFSAYFPKASWTPGTAR